jgi:hypothetical protein
VCSTYKKNAKLSKFHPACEQTKILSLDQDRSHDEGTNHARNSCNPTLPYIIIRHFMNTHCGGGAGGREPGRIRAGGEREAGGDRAGCGSREFSNLERQRQRQRGKYNCLYCCI